MRVCVHLCFFYHVYVKAFKTIQISICSGNQWTILKTECMHLGKILLHLSSILYNDDLDSVIHHGNSDN